MAIRRLNCGEAGSVLVPAGPGPKAYWCVRSLAACGVKPIIGSEYRLCPASASRFCKEFVSLPSPHDDLIEYKDELVDIAARPDVRTIIPIRAHDTYVLSKYYNEFDEHVSLVIPPLETLKTVHDRLKLFERAAEIGVPIPETRVLEDVDEWSADYIIKSRFNILVDEYHPSLSPADLEVIKSVKHVGGVTVPNRGEVCTEMKHEPIVQEYVQASAPYVFGALYEHGEALATFQHEQIRGNSYTGGGGVYRIAVSEPELERVGRALLDELDWHGLVCIEYLRDERTGEFKLIEINPRMWQSLACAVKAGADFPYYYWLQATGRTNRIEPSYEVGVGSHWLYGELRYLFNILYDGSDIVDPPSLTCEIRDIATSFYQMPNFDDFCLNDPLPFFKGLGFAIHNKRP